MLSISPFRSRFVCGVIAAGVAVFALGNARTAEATCGDYLLYPGSSGGMTHDHAPVPVSRCSGGNCRRAPAEAPFESSVRLSELQLRVRCAFARDVAADVEREAGRMPLPESDDRPESANASPFDRPPEFSRTV